MLRQNLQYKILALLLAIFMWFYVIFTQRQGVQNRAFTVPLEVRHLRPGQVATVEPRQVQVVLRGRADVLASPAPAPAAYVDASETHPGRQTAPVHPVVPAQAQVVRVMPGKVRLTIEPIVTRTMRVEADLVGAPPPGYILGEPQINPAAVVVSGVRDAVGAVRRVTASIEAGRIPPGAPQRAEVRAVDERGAPVPAVAVSPRAVQAILPVERTLTYQTVPVLLATEGSPAAGFRVSGVTVRPQVVTIAAEQQRLRQVAYLRTAPLNLEGAQADLRRTVALVLPQGVTTVGEPQVQVTIDIEPQ